VAQVGKKALLTWMLTGLPVLLLLLAVIFYGTAGKIHNQLLQSGEHHWPGYREFRTDPPPPDCDPDAIGAEEDHGTEVSEEDFDDLDALFGEVEEGPSEDAIAAARELCIERIASYERIQTALQSSNLRRFRWIETGVAEVVHVGVEYSRHVLVLLMMFCALTATVRRAHIALRSATSRRPDRITQAFQLGANLLLAYSFWTLHQIHLGAGIEQVSKLPLLWLGGFAAMAVVNVAHLIRPRPRIDAEPSWGRTLLGVPLYVAMAIITGLYFGLIENHIAGLAIFLDQLTEHALLYINVGLYVWTGMLLKRTLLAEHAFAIVRPWKLPPEILAFVVVSAAAIPTAYSGASGIFVIAAGAIIYRELRQAGTRRGFAQAATAMSGSMGVVLSPCLLVVIVAALNKEVTTDELFHKGLWVFALNLVIFLIGCLIVRRGPFTLAPVREALPQSARALARLIPYGIVGALVILFFHIRLETPFDEHSAPLILPVVLMAMLLYDRFYAKGKARKAAAAPAADAPATPAERPAGFFRSLFDATSESSVHTGALLALMGLSICLGGIIERGELMAYVPQAFASPSMAMLVLVVVLVFIGMCMDPYGAVILVSSTLAAVAYASGIVPVHFWLTVLCAFELGYLTPPVALNHLLTRQVIGEEEYRPVGSERDTFWHRHERVLFPIAIKVSVLILVAFVPLWF